MNKIKKDGKEVTTKEKRTKSKKVFQTSEKQLNWDAKGMWPFPDFVETKSSPKRKVTK